MAESEGKYKPLREIIVETRKAIDSLEDGKDKLALEAKLNQLENECKSTFLEMYKILTSFSHTIYRKKAGLVPDPFRAHVDDELLGQAVLINAHEQSPHGLKKMEANTQDFQVYAAGLVKSIQSGSYGEKEAVEAIKEAGDKYSVFRDTVKKFQQTLNNSFLQDCKQKRELFEKANQLEITHRGVVVDVLRKIKDHTPYKFHSEYFKNGTPDPIVATFDDQLDAEVLYINKGF